MKLIKELLLYLERIYVVVDVEDGMRTLHTPRGDLHYTCNYEILDEEKFIKTLRRLPVVNHEEVKACLNS